MENHRLAKCRMDANDGHRNGQTDTENLKASISVSQMNTKPLEQAQVP